MGTIFFGFGYIKVSRGYKDIYESFTMPHALRGAGDVKYTMIASIVSMWAGRVIVGYILITFFHLGILGVWIGMFVDWYIRGISFLIRFISRRWLEKRAV